MDKIKLTREQVTYIAQYIIEEQEYAKDGFNDYLLSDNIEYAMEAYNGGAR